jgi:hypothetical protein
MSSIFINYRRSDTSGYAGRLFDRLADRFGRQRVFMDIEALAPGTDFVAAIDQAVGSCEALIALIGIGWLDAVDAKGRRRLDDPHDYIRLEIATALRRGVPLIPVLVEGARMPSADELPADLAALARRQALELSDTRWDYDVGRLIQAIEVLSRQDRPSGGQRPETDGGAPTRVSASQASRRWRLAVAAAVLLALGVGFGLWQLAPQLLDTGRQAPQPRPGAAVDAARPVAEPPSARLSAPQPEPYTPVPAPARITVPVPDREIQAGGPAEPSAAAAEEPVPPPPPPGEGSPGVREGGQTTARRLAELLEQAEVDIAAWRLTRPPGNNAYERYQRVLELDPDNQPARAGLGRVGKAYLELARRRLEEGALAEVERYLGEAERFIPASPELGELNAALEERRRAEEAMAAERRGRSDAREGRPGAAREECLAACERADARCRERLAPSSADHQACREAGLERCEREHQRCQRDPQRLFIEGPVGTRAACAGEWQNCVKRVTEECGPEQRATPQHCEAELAACVAACGPR